jgi:transposase
MWSRSSARQQQGRDDTDAGGGDENAVKPTLEELTRSLITQHMAQLDARQNSGGQHLHEHVTQLTHQLEDTQASIAALEVTVSSQMQAIQEILGIVRRDRE